MSGRDHQATDNSADTGRRVRGIAPLRDFIHTEAAGGVLLVAATILAVLAANSPWRKGFFALWHTEMSFSIASRTISMDLHHWVNDGLMTVFFLVVGLEIKREMTQGHLAGRRALVLPVVAAAGGMLMPAALYLLIAGRSAATGWGVPMATDIALAVGVLALAGSHVAPSVRAYLLGLAVVDDIGAILVIAVFYSSGVSGVWLMAGALAVAGSVLAGRMGEYRLVVHLPLGCMLWLALFQAGVHPTLAGVVMGLLAPVTPLVTPDLVDVEELTSVSTVEAARASAQTARSSVSLVEWLEHVLHPWTSYMIVPLFALANAGIEVSVTNLRSALESSVFWGIIAGLVIGKPLGVLLFTKLAVRLILADAPGGARSAHLRGAGHAAGIGFTVALFIAELAFKNEHAETHAADAKMAILLASVISGALAFLVLRRQGR